MTDDSAPLRVFRINELTRFIASQLILINQQSAVNLACACRYLEEPVLSTLWETHRSLNTLLRVFPEETWEVEDDVLWITRDPPPGAWHRVRRYAAWMHHVQVDEESSEFGDDTFRRLRLNSPAAGRWFPALRDLTWCITRYNFPYADLFFSPHLENVSILMSSTWLNSEVPHDILPAITSTISAIPGSSLQRLHISRSSRRVPWEHFKESLSSVVLRCGPSLTEFTSPIPLSDAAVDHLIHLPHLRIWHIEHPPPNYSVFSLPLTSPPLVDLSLGKSACEWLSLFGRLEGCTSPAQGVTPLSRLKESLETLNIEYLSGPMTDISVASPIQMFRNLNHLDVEAFCRGGDGGGPCTFMLDNDNIAKLAMALPQLGLLALGDPCFENTCATTVACLLSISVYCVKLDFLAIHFNTTNILEDFKNISEDPEFRELRSLPRGRLSLLEVCAIPLTVDESEYKTVADGMIDIFPSLKCCEGMWGVWHEVSNYLRRVDAPMGHQRSGGV